MEAAGAPEDPGVADDGRASVRARAGGAAIVILVAAAVGLVNAGDRYRTGRPVYAGQAFGLWQVTWPYLVRAWIWAGFYPAVRALCRRWPPARFHDPRVLAAHVAGALFLTPLAIEANNVASSLLLGEPLGLGDVVGEAFLRMLVLGWRYHLIAYGIVLAAAAGVESARRARREALRDVELRTRLAAARLETLRAQLHPHFLFNTLNGVLPLIEDDPEAAVRAVSELSALFRESLSDGSAVSDVAAELRFLERYLGLLKLRFGDRLDYALEAGPGTARATVPRLLLQPLVENAVEHGLGVRPEGGRVEVDVRRVGDALVLEVRDDGPGLARDHERDGARGLGLANTRARLAALHGDRQSLVVSPRGSGGVVVRIEMPFEEAA